MDFGKTIAYIAFYLVSLAIFYYYFTTRNKEKMALIESGANPDAFKSPERFYILFVVGLVAVGISLGVVLGYYLVNVQSNFSDSIILLGSMLLTGGLSMVISFFIILYWIRKNNK